MTCYEIVPATEAHAVALAPLMRNKDALECEAYGHTTLSALRHSLGLSIEAFTGLVDGKPVCMFGYTTECLMADSAQPWLLGTDEMARHALAFLRRNRPYIADLRKRFNKLDGWVYDQNHSSIRWLRWLGFIVSPEISVIGGLPFRSFSWER